MEVFDNDLYNYLEQKEYECRECGTPMENDNYYCSRDCFKASML